MFINAVAMKVEIFSLLVAILDFQESDHDARRSLSFFVAPQTFL